MTERYSVRPAQTAPEAAMPGHDFGGRRAQPLAAATTAAGERDRAMQDLRRVAVNCSWSDELHPNDATSRRHCGHDPVAARVDCSCSQCARRAAVALDLRANTDEGFEERILDAQVAATEPSDVHRTPEQRVECATPNCRRAAAVCDECVRALALMFFGGIARHPELRERGSIACALCELGAASWCPACAVNGAQGVTARRRHLREYGGYTDIRVGRDIPEGAHLSLEQLAELQAAARRGGWTGFKRGRLDG